MRNISILIADNSAWTRAMVRRTLETRFGASTVYEAEDGRRAIAFLEALRIDLVITAVELAHTSGIELLEYVKDHPKLGKIPVLVISSHEDERTRVAAIQHGAVRYLPKPFTPDALEHAVRTSWSDASRRKSKRFSGLPPHTLTLESGGDEVTGRILDISEVGLAGHFPYFSTYELYSVFRLSLRFEATRTFGELAIGPFEATLLRIEGSIDQLGDEEPSCVLAFHVVEEGMDAASRDRLELLLARLAAEVPEYIADSEAEK